MTYTAFTVCNFAYLHRALALAESFYKHNSIKLIIVIVDTKREVPKCSFVDIKFIEDYQIDDFLHLAFKYDIIELSTALKPYLARLFLKKFDSVLFLDPDTYVYGKFTRLINDYKKYSVVLTPHYLKPQGNSASESDLNMMRFGSFNLGFFIVNNNDEGLRFLDWWWQRCKSFCFMESQFGLSTDQKWVTVAPALFRNLKVCFDTRLNVAYWNLFERRLICKGDDVFTDDGRIIFFHFSNFNANDLDYSKKTGLDPIDTSLEAVKILASNYYDAIQIFDVVDTKYGFDYDSEGRYISPTLRRVYVSIVDSGHIISNPFTSVEMSRIGKKYNLYEKNNSKYAYKGFASLKGRPFSLRFFDFGLRLTLRIFGPNKFFDFTRLLVYRSMIWKYDFFK
jgi:hypothetical protein